MSNQINLKDGVSIHALLAECDQLPIPPSSTRPEFQSTHSLRSATIRLWLISRLLYSFNPRTPCGVRRGGRRTFPGLLCFNPRTPCGVRLLASFGLKLFHMVSIHALLAECDYFLAALIYHTTVSIHALLAECDIRLWLISRLLYSFNPRTPCGVRLGAYDVMIISSVFQSTHSLRSATNNEQSD